MQSPSEAERDLRLYVEDMLEFSERAMRYAQGLSPDALLQDTLRYDANLRNIELIGEAATHLGPAERAGAAGAVARDRRHAKPCRAWLPGHLTDNRLGHPERRTPGPEAVAAGHAVAHAPSGREAWSLSKPWSASKAFRAPFSPAGRLE